MRVIDSVCRYARSPALERRIAPRNLPHSAWLWTSVAQAKIAQSGMQVTPGKPRMYAPSAASLPGALRWLINRSFLAGLRPAEIGQPPESGQEADLIKGA